MNHDIVEKNVGLMIILVIVAISFGTLVELVPLFFIKQTNEPIAGLKPLPALELEGRDIYIREGCNTCHSQMIRPLRAETERYGHYSVAGESVYNHPFLWGSKRTGPDLARVGGYVDNRAPGALGDHLRGGNPAALGKRLDVDLELEFPIIRARLECRPHTNHSCIVDQSVELPEGLERPLDGTSDCTRIPDVGIHCDSTAA